MPTLSSYYALLAPELGEDFQSTAVTGSSTSQLTDTAWPIQTSLSADDAHAGEVLWRPAAVVAADRVRYVLSNVAATGVLTPDHVWANAPANGEVYHLLGGLAPVDGSGLDMRSLINEGLKRTYVPVEVIGTPTLQDTRHDLGTIAPWMLSETWVLRVGLLHTGEDRNKVDPYWRIVEGRIIRNGASFLLDTYPQQFNPTDTLYLEILKRGYDHCRATAGVWGSQAGLVLDSDESPVPSDWATASALVIAWRRLRRRLARNPDLPRDRLEAAAWMTQLARNYTNHLQRTFKPPLSRFGPSVPQRTWPATRIVVI